MAASTKDQLQKLSKAPLKVKVGLLVGVLALLGAAYYFLFYSDMQTQLDELKRKTTKLAKEEETLQQRKKQYLDLLQQKLELEKELRKNSVMLPTTAELPAFFVHLQSQSLAANVSVEKVSREEEVRVETFVKVPVGMTIVGTFYEINEYFKLLYETPRIITVENLTIGNAKVDGDQLRLTAKFVASTFRQPDNLMEAQPTAPSAPKAAGGRKK